MKIPITGYPSELFTKATRFIRPGREPSGYMDWLKHREPQVVFDDTTLKTSADWVAAGETVFNAPTSFAPMFFSAENLLDPAFYGSSGMPVASDGTIPFARWVVRRKGVVELGSMGCATCHTRVLADGTLVPGAQGNNPNDRQGANLLRVASRAMGNAKALERVQGFARQFEVPWLSNDPNRRVRGFSLEEFIAAGEAIPPGVSARANTSMMLPPQTPDLIGVRERRFLDHTGLIRQSGIGDLMRYSSLAQDVFSASRYGGVQDAAGTPGARYSDAQLYALAQYLYSLTPPRNPNVASAASRRGELVFQKEGCAGCHTAPLYTNNKLTPVDGFIPEGTNKDSMAKSVGTDPRYALSTRKGTGYYKVPSLKGVWYRGPFGHDGAAATLEEWFDPARLNANYVPQGFKGADGKNRSIPGHTFGLRISPADRDDLLSFLRTL
ncbi:MAG: di-heme oxidoredictase family protein [Bryobacteraceae bacterium]